ALRDAREVMRGDARPVVEHAERERPPAVALLEDHRDMPPSMAIADGVVDEVRERLLEERHVGPERDRRLGHREVEGETALVRDAAMARDDPPDERVQVDAREARERRARFEPRRRAEVL